ncbi:MAG: tRNA (adenosine(37)-N6)-threonylcarbamoyltransferase complex ATPase subunit type 1 TsaE [Bacteroidetes bacterium]|nr:tRNA (adenosine(37)-N6)-threonylcarbamoyltransferase complex ATPase subunit type 1 TsaE [Bacteroidota bacterium]
MEVNFTLDQLPATAQALAAELKPSAVIAFHGEMGAGKTTFIHALCEAMKVAGTVSSPTFSIINQYSTNDGRTIYHMDLYRMKNENEAINAGVEDCLYSGNTCLVEWPEKAPGIFPDDTLHCYISLINDNTRKLRINL